MLSPRPKKSCGLGRQLIVIVIHAGLLMNYASLAISGGGLAMQKMSSIL
jgi:hypothetical protein